MILKMYTDILSIISVSMYDSRLSPEYQRERLIEDLQDAPRKDKKVRELLEILENEQYEFDIDRYKNTIGGCAVEVLAEFFDDISTYVKVKLHYGFMFHPPKYYNYETDSISFQVEIEENEIEKIRRVVENDNNFFDWIYKNYRTRDGFNSYMPYEKEDFIKALKGEWEEFEDKKSGLPKAISMYIMYVANNSENIEIDYYQQALEEAVEEHGRYDLYIIPDYVILLGVKYYRSIIIDDVNSMIANGFSNNEILHEYPRFKRREIKKFRNRLRKKKGVI